MLGHNVFHVPIDDEVHNLPWFETETGVRRISWMLGGVLLVYWGWFIAYLAMSADEGLVVPRVLIGLVPLVLLGAITAKRPRVGGLLTAALGLVAAGFIPGVDVAVMVGTLSVAAGGLMAFSTHH